MDRDDQFNGSDLARGQLGYLAHGISLLTAGFEPGQ
jgi:hypothetical protein